MVTRGMQLLALVLLSQGAAANGRPLRPSPFSSCFAGRACTESGLSWDVALLGQQALVQVKESHSKLGIGANLSQPLSESARLVADVCGKPHADPEFRSESSTAAVRCCADGGGGMTVKPCATATYSEAMLLCSDSDMRICSPQELTAACGTGCGFDRELVWTDLLEGVGKSYWVEDACGKVNVEAQFLNEHLFAAVRCCSLDGSSGSTPRPCKSSATYEEAVAECTSRGQRLCTASELPQVCRTGCRRLNRKAIWTSQEESASPTPEPTTTLAPTSAPTSAPTNAAPTTTPPPTSSPTTTVPTMAPTMAPTTTPAPTLAPTTAAPTMAPTTTPAPTMTPTTTPAPTPAATTTLAPTLAPTTTPAPTATTPSPTIDCAHPEPSSGPRATTAGCPCLQQWTWTAYSSCPCESSCCNPDQDPNGAWCFVEGGCGNSNWGYCAESGSPVTAPTPAPTLAPTTSPGQVHPKEWEHFSLINSRRRAGFTCPDETTYPANSQDLVFDCRLWRAARLHSKDMGETGTLSHTGSDGSRFWERAEDQGIGANGENIAYGHESAERTLDQFLGSETGHCNNLMNPGFTMAGVGYWDSSPPAWYHWWTELFKTTLVAADTSCYPDASLLESGLPRLRRTMMLPNSSWAAAGEPCTRDMATCL